MDKKEIRLLIKNLILQNQDTLAQKSASICNKIMSSPQFQNSQEIFAYMALPDEVDLSPVIYEALKQGKKVAVPKIINQQRAEIQFFYLNKSQNFGSQTQSGTFGIAEPDPSQLEAAEFSGNTTLILVPGRAFTKEGDRLGRGKGYYDKYLGDRLLRCARNDEGVSAHNDVVVAGVCFDFQIKKSLPVDDRDIKMDMIFYK